MALIWSETGRLDSKSQTTWKGQKTFSLNFGDLIATVVLKHTGKHVTVDHFQLLVESESVLPPMPPLALSFKVQKTKLVYNKGNCHDITAGELFEIENVVGRDDWETYDDNEIHYELTTQIKPQRVIGEYKQVVIFRLDLKLNFDNVSKPSNLTKQLNYPTVQDFFTDSKIRDETSDFKIICEDEELRCHKLILGLRSDFFKTMFNGDMKEANQGFLNIEEFKLKTMKSFHKYLYTDSIDQSEIDIDLLRAAHMYDFKRLVGECEYGLSLKINEKNVKELFEVACTLELPTLFDQAKQKIQEMMNEWGQNETITRMNQIKQVFGSLILGGSGNVSMDGFDEILKNKLNEYFESKE